MRMFVFERKEKKERPSLQRATVAMLKNTRFRHLSVIYQNAHFISEKKSRAERPKRIYRSCTVLVYYRLDLYFLLCF